MRWDNNKVLMNKEVCFRHTQPDKCNSWPLRQLIVERQLVLINSILGVADLKSSCPGIDERLDVNCCHYEIFYQMI